MVKHQMVTVSGCQYLLTLCHVINPVVLPVINMIYFNQASFFLQLFSVGIKVLI